MAGAICKPTRTHWKVFLYGSLVDELMRKSGEIDVYAIRGKAVEGKPPAPIAPQRTSSWPDYGISALGVGLSTAVSFLMYPYFELSNLIMVYLLGVVTVALRGRHGPSILASVLSVLAFDVFFVPPHWTFGVADTQYLVTFAVMLLVGLVISHLTVLSRQQAETARLRESRTAAMHALSRQLASSRGAEKLLQIAVKHIGEVFDSQVIALLPDTQGKLLVRADYRAEFSMDAKEQSVAQWVYDLGQMAGLGTQMLPFVDAVYVPLLGNRGPVGALRVKPTNPQQLVIPEQLRLLEAFASQTALALEVDRLQEEARRTQVQIESERLRSALLSAVSHDLRSPLSAIIGSASSLVEMGDSLEAGERRELAQNIHDEAERLSRLVNNLLQATQLEAGALEPKRESHNLEDIIGTALQYLHVALTGRPVEVRLSPDLPLVPVDELLLGQVLVNLLENAVRYTPEDSPIVISAERKGDSVLVEVVDCGPGLPPQDLERVFDKFYRSPSHELKGGAGLGLAICRGIVELHGGRIWAENQFDGGAAFRFTLPLQATARAAA